MVKALRSLDAIAVENPALPGTPDVNYIEGWVELKWLRSWPKQPGTLVKFDHFTVQQRVWHIRRRRAGGRTWMLIQCKREWILLDGAVAALNVNLSTRTELIYLAEAYWANGLNQKDLVACVSQEQKPFTLTESDVAKLRKTLPAATGLG